MFFLITSDQELSNVRRRKNMHGYVALFLMPTWSATTLKLIICLQMPTDVFRQLHLRTSVSTVLGRIVI